MTETRLAYGPAPRALKIVQHNISRSIAVADELCCFCSRNSIDIALVCEPYTRQGCITGLEDGVNRIIKSRTNNIHGIWAAIVVFNPTIEIMAKPQLGSEFFAVASVALPGQEPVDLVSGYFQYRRDTAHFTRYLCDIWAALAPRVSFALDVNASSVRWHGQITNRRGRIVEGMIDQLGLSIMNKANQPYAFSGNRGRSNIDVTLSSDRIAHAIDGWTSLADVTSSDHSVILYELREDIDMIAGDPGGNLPFEDKRIGEGLGRRVAANLRNTPCDRSMDLDGRAKRLTEAIVQACETTLPKRKREKKALPPWWSNDLRESRTALNRARRAWRRTGGLEDRAVFNSARNIHVGLLRKAKKEMWIRLTSEPFSEKTKWGKVTRWIVKGRRLEDIPSAMRRSDGSYTGDLKETMDHILEELIPHSDQDASFAEIREWPPGERITTDDLKRLIWEQKFKAPGFDRITARILRALWEEIKAPLEEVVNEALTSCEFPSTWKGARVVIIRKARDKGPLLAKSYRPVSLLPVLGKVLEGTVCEKLDAEVGGNLSADQHGFRPGRSTETAMRAVIDWVDGRVEKHVLGSFLDISGAFDNVRWTQLTQDMGNAGCSGSTITMTKSYLTDRTATYIIGGQRKDIVLTRGAPQGSKLGPRIWTITMDSLLKGERQESTKIIAYADDIALLVAGKTREEVIRDTETELKAIIRWASMRGLTFSKEKSVMVPLKGGLTPGFTAAFDGGRIKSADRVKYLGVIFGSNITFNDHVVSAINKSQDLFSRLRSVRRSKWGLSSAHALLIYNAVYLPRVVYACGIWYDRVARYKSTLNKMESAQRQALLAVSGAYRTTSTRALQVITGLPPLHLSVEYRSKISNGMSREAAYEALTEKWQELRETSDKGRWTFKFFPTIASRLEVTIPFGHYTAQMVSGHGDFNKKLFDLGLTTDPICRCGREDETAEHVLLECDFTTVARAELSRVLAREGEPWPGDMHTLVGTMRKWKAFSTFAESVLRQKERERLERDE